MFCLSQIQRVNLHTCAVLLSYPGNTYSGNTILIPIYSIVQKQIFESRNKSMETTFYAFLRSHLFVSSPFFFPCIFQPLLLEQFLYRWLLHFLLSTLCLCSLEVLFPPLVYIVCHFLCRFTALLVFGMVYFSLLFFYSESLLGLLLLGKVFHLLFVP